MERVIVGVICIVILVGLLFISRKFNYTKLESEMKELHKTKKNLEIEINVKQQQLNNLNRELNTNEIKEINVKLDSLLNRNSKNELNLDDVKEANIKLNILLKKSNESGSDNVILVFLFILVATGVILGYKY